MHRFTWMAAGAIAVVSTAAADPQGAWELYPNAPFASPRFEDVFTADEDHVWAVAFTRITASTDGGESWTQQVDSGPAFRSGTAVSDQVAFVGSLTPGQALWETTDAGDTWNDISVRIAGPPVLGICGMWAASSSVIYGVGRYDGIPRLVKTTDGGSTWTSQAMDAYCATLVDVTFLDELHGFTVGGTDAVGGTGAAIVLETTDGGATWASRHVSEGTGEWGWKISFPSTTVGYASTENFSNYARVLKTTDGGATWTDIVIPAHDPLQGIGFVSEAVGWISGRGTSSFTSDGGSTWQSSDLDDVVNRIRFVGDTGFAAGRYVYRYFPTQVSEAMGVPEGAHTVLHPSSPNPFADQATIRFEIARAGLVRLQVFDVTGRRVRTLLDGVRSAGTSVVAWDGTDGLGTRVAPGVYFYALDAGGGTLVRRAVIAR